MVPLKAKAAARPPQLELLFLKLVQGPNPCKTLQKEQQSSRGWNQRVVSGELRQGGLVLRRLWALERSEEFSYVSDFNLFFSYENREV